jgi:membrane-bound lytic murein transglycosylase D
MEFAEVKEGQILILAPGVKSSSEVRSAVSDEDELKSFTHTVMKGETVFSIARHYGISSQTIISANPNLQNGEQLIVDQVISLVPQNEKKTGTVIQKPNIHYVKPGETLYALSVKYGITIEELKSLNSLKNNSIWVGQKLKLN